MGDHKKVYLVDGSGYIFRAFYAVQPLSTRDGFPTNALFGFFRMLISLLKQHDSGHVVMVFDTGEKTFRHKLYDQYKANRKECPEDLAKQMPYFRDISRALGLKVLEQPGYEADDVIGTLARRLDSAAVETVIISGDKDLMQLVGGNISIWDAMKDAHIGPEQVRAKFGVGPDKVVEVLALIGDSSDNVPGVDGIGPKTATQLIEKFGSAEEVLAHRQAIATDKSIRGQAKIAQQLELQAEQLRLSRKLVEIDCNTPLEVTTNGSKVMLTELSSDDLYSALVRGSPREEELRGLVDRFEFHSIMEGLDLAPKPEQRAEKSYDYRTVLRADFPKFLAELSAQNEFSLDIESTSLDALEARVVGMSFCWNDSVAYYVPVAHERGLLTPGNDVDQVSANELLEALAPILRSTAVGKIGQNLKYDLSVLFRHGVEVQGVAFDTMVASYLLSPDRRGHNLSVLAHEYLGRTLTEYEELVDKDGTFAQVSIEKATAYSGQDAHCAWLLRAKLAPLLKQNQLEELFRDIEMPLVPLLARLEITGVKLDTKSLSAMSQEFAGKLELLEKQCYELAGCQFNLNSPKQLSEVLFEKLAIPTKGLKKTKTGISTDSGVLEQISELHPLPKALLEYRSLYKLKSTYVDALPAQISKVTNRLHTRFNQTVTGTGRLSSSDPNLQNIPIRTAEGRRIRSAFVAEPGNTLIVADYSQIELRLLAHLSADENLIRSFRENLDIHSQTAREIMGLGSEESISSDMRRMGKTINFGIVYGMGAYRLARELEIPLSTAKAYIEGYFARYPRVKSYFESVAEGSKQSGYVTTLFGRKRFIGDIDATGRDKEFVMRAALNAPLQGSAADLIKLAMVRIDRRITQDKLPVKMILQVHDELVFECVEGEAYKVASLMQEEMEQVATLSVPLKVDVGIGKSWQEAHG